MCGEESIGITTKHLLKRGCYVIGIKNSRYECTVECQLMNISPLVFSLFFTESCHSCSVAFRCAGQKQECTACQCLRCSVTTEI